MRLKTRIDGLSFDARLKALQAVTPSLVTVAGQTTKYEQSLSRGDEILSQTCQTTKYEQSLSKR